MKRSKKMLSIILALVMAITCVIPVFADTYATSGTCGKNVAWSYDTSTYTLTISGTGAMEDYNSSNRPWESCEDKIRIVVIESGVASISEYAFYDCDYLTDVTIANTVKFIGAHAFESCYILKNINIPDSVKLISDYAFYDCDFLTSLTIPDSVISIGNSAFEDCYNLKTVNITDVSAWCNITFNGSSSNPLYCGADLYLNGAIVTDLVIPDNVTKLNAYVFYSCDCIESVTIPDSVTLIGSSAFSGCTGLTSVIIGDSVTTIGSSAFSGCTSLTSVIIGDSVTTIGNSAFSSCTNLTSIKIGDNVKRIDDNVFTDCANLETVNISNVSSWCNIYFKSEVSNPLFYGADLYINGTKVTDLVIPCDVTKLNDYVFYNCKTITNVTIPDSVTQIGSYAFYGCENITSISTGDGVTRIGELAFSGCTNLRTISFGKSVKNIDGTIDYEYGIKLEYGLFSVFNNCTNLECITVNDENQYFSSDECGVLFNKYKTNLYIYPAGNTNESYSIPNTVTTIEAAAFGNAKNLVEITIPNSVTDFGYIHYLISGFNKKFGLNFANCSNLKSIAIPDGVSRIYENTFDGCTSLEEVTIPNSVETIDAYAFKDCLELSDVYYTDTEENWNEIDIDSHNEWLLVATKHFKEHSFGEWKTVNNRKERICSICGYVDVDYTKNFGDLNGDGYTSAKEARIILQCVAGLRDIDLDLIESADVNQDGNISAVDARIVLQMVAGLREPEDGWNMISYDTSTTGPIVSSLTVTADKTNVSIGDKVVVTVVLPEKSGISALTIKANYDSSVLKPIEMKAGNLGATVNVNTGVATMAAAETFETSGTICTMTFQVLKTGSADITFDIIEACDSYWSDVNLDVNTVKITVGEESTTEPEEPSTEPDYPDDPTEPEDPCVDGHTWSTWAVEKVAECKKDGLKARNCIVCGEKETEVIPATGICSFKWVVTKEATATEYGEKVLKCTMCGHVKEIQKLAPTNPCANGHNYTSTITVPTCTEQGYTIYTCSTCGDKYRDDYTTALGHNYTSIVTAPTCSKHGYTTYTCSVCGDIYIDNYTPFTEHNYTWYTISVVTCETDGVMLGECTVCGETDVKATLKTGHNIVDGVCQNCGYTENGENDNTNTDDNENVGNEDNNNEEVTDPSENCSCNCHKSGISNFFFKISLFFQKIFGSNKTCSCGVAHY